MKHNALWLLGLAAVTALVVAGCGGGGDDSTSTSSLAKPAWIAKADAICQQGNQEIEQAANEQFGKQNAAMFGDAKWHRERVADAVLTGAAEPAAV